MTQEASPISASKGSVPLEQGIPDENPQGTPREMNVPAVGRENTNPENPDEGDARTMPSNAQFSPGDSGPTGSEEQAGRAALPREAVRQSPNDKDTDPNADGPHGTPDNTWSTAASDSEADVDGSLDASRMSPQGVDGVRASDS